MGQWTNSNIRSTVTDGPFHHANMSRCTVHLKKKKSILNCASSKILNANNEFCCLRGNIYLSEVSIPSFLDHGQCLASWQLDS